MPLLDLDPQSGTPIYRQIVEQVRRMVASGRLRSGDELPSVRVVAREQAVNPMTVSRAYSLLETEGLLERQPGRPMRIRTTGQPTGSPAERVRELEGDLRELIRAARQLGLDEDTLTQALQSIFREEDR